ncbi:DUF221-domain-containing protein [Xylariaceae sp. FL1651]|nr:DUF221-domain-containing protein [Xylariaceae sp. FL1651]
MDLARLDLFGDSMELTTMVPKPKGSTSLAAVISAFVPTWVTGLLFVGIFILIRQRYRNIYAPRTFLGTVPEKDRTPSASQAYLDWVHTMRKLPDKYLLFHQSLDAYLYLRFLRTVIFICLVGCGLTWPILMPVNATGGGSSTELDKISISNVKKKNHLYAHAIMAWVFLGFVMFTVARERFWLIGLRQAWTLSTPNAKRVSSRTVLFLSAPRDSLEESNMTRFFGDGAVRIWPVTKPEVLQTLVSERNALVEKLESAEASLIRKANSKKIRKSIDGQNRDVTKYSDLPESVKKAIRPRSKPTTSPLSKKIDTIEWLREQVKEKGELIEEMRRSHKSGEPHGAAAVFVEFRTQAEAQRACQQVASSNPLALVPRYPDVKPNEVIWDNLTIPPAKRVSQEGIALAIVILTIVFWSIPSGFVGLVSNISYLAENFEWLRFLNNLPDPIIGLLSGLVPPLLTSLLSKYVPTIFRYVFKSFGGPTNTANELKVQKWFYVFQVTQVFLVTAVFSGAATVASQLAKQIQDPTSIPALLARQLPKSSNYYLTYFIVQGITSAADNLLNYSNLLQYLFFYHFVDKTPRQKFNRYTSMRGIAWGKVFPKFANFAIIAIAYSCIAPLVLGFAAAGLALYYFSYRYNLFYVIQPKVDTKGQAYTLALQHLLTGVYIAELALIGFFGLRTAKGPTIMMGLLFIVTVLYNVLMNKYMSPLEKFMPADLVSQETGDETTPLLSSAEEGQASSMQRLNQSARISSPVAKHVVTPTTRFFDPNVFASYDSMKSWIQDGDHYDIEDDEVPGYSEEDLKRAYLHPALTSQTPLIWMARDRMGVSQNEIRETEECGLKASDEGAWLDEKGNIQWSVLEFDKVPVWKKGVKY